MSASPDGAPRPPRHRVDPRARTYWLLTSSSALLLVIIVTGVPAWLWEAGRPWFVTIGGLLTAVLLPRTLIAPWLRYRIHRWEATGTAVYSKTGWLSRKWHIAPLSRVQTVEAKRNPLHQALGLAAVSITTASAQGAITIQGLDADVAEELVAALTLATEHTRGDAT